MAVIKLKAKYNRAHYKTTNSYLSAVYRKNKEAINAIFTEDQKRQMKTTGVTPYQAWRARLTEISKDQYTKKLYGDRPKVNQLLDRFARSTQMRTKAEIMQENAFVGLMGDLKKSKEVKTNRGTLKVEGKDRFEDFRRITGWKTKLDPRNISYDSKNKRYEYRTDSGMIQFDFTSSPKEVRILYAENFKETRQS